MDLDTALLFLFVGFSITYGVKYCLRSGKNKCLECQTSFTLKANAENFLCENCNKKRSLLRTRK